MAARELMVISSLPMPSITDDLTARLEAGTARAWRDLSAIRELFEAAEHVEFAARATANPMTRTVDLKKEDLDPPVAMRTVDIISAALARALVTCERDRVLDPSLPRSLLRLRDLGAAADDGLRALIAEGAGHPVIWMPPALLLDVALETIPGAIPGPTRRPHGQWGTFRGFPVITLKAAPPHALWIFDAGGAQLCYGPDPERPVSIAARGLATGVVLTATLPLAVEARVAARFLRFELVDWRPPPDA